MMGDAIVRTLWRIFVSRRHLLEWTPAAQATAGKRLDLRGFALRMAGALGLAVVGLVRRAAVRARSVADRGAVRRALAGLARRRAFGQPAAGARTARGSRRRRITGAAADRAPHLALSSKRS